MKKIFVAILLLGVIFSFAGCGGKEDKKVIEFWTLQLSPTFNDYFKSLIKEFEQKNPGTVVKWIDIPFDAAIQKLMAAAAAGQTPDVVNLSSDFLAKFYGMNALIDFKTKVSEDTLAWFLESALQNCTFEGKLIGLPWYLNTYVLIYNTEYIKQAGFDEKDLPATFDELIDFSKQYTKATGKFALFWNIGKDSYLPMMLGSEDVQMTDSPFTKATFNLPRAVALIDKWIQLYKAGVMPGESIISPGSSIIEPFQSGQVAMVFTGPVFLKRVKENAPGIYASTGVAPAVVGKTGKHELAAMSISVMKNSRNIDEAVRFSLFLLNAVNQLKFSKIETTFPSVKEALADSYFTSDDGSLETKAKIIGARELPAAVRLQKYLLHPQFDRLRDAFDEAIQKAALGKASTQQALDEAVEKWNKILEEN